MELAKRKIKDITPYKNNPRNNTEAVAGVAESIKQCGYVSPIIIDEDGIILAGHTRRLALLELYGEDYEAPVVVKDGLTEEQKRKYRILDNKVAETATWDFGKLAQEIEGLDFGGFDFGLLSEQLNEEEIRARAFFGDREGYDDEREQDDEYDAFLEKFKDKHTTDDCYTPDKVHDVVMDYVERRYGLKRENFVRPFYPGGDYQAYKYKPTDVVVDNPPFSIESEIRKFYYNNGIKYFLYCSGLTPFSGDIDDTVICAGAAIIYENGADVCTSFVTNLESEYAARSDVELNRAIKRAIEEIQKETARELTKNDYPDNVVMAPMLNRYSKYGVEYKVRRVGAKRIRILDEQKEKKKAMFGSGFLVSDKLAAEKAAAEKAVAEKAVAEKWKLSEREKNIVKALNEADR